MADNSSWSNVASPMTLDKLLTELLWPIRGAIARTWDIPTYGKTANTVYQAERAVGKQCAACVVGSKRTWADRFPSIAQMQPPWTAWPTTLDERSLLFPTKCKTAQYRRTPG